MCLITTNSRPSVNKRIAAAKSEKPKKSTELPNSSPLIGRAICLGIFPLSLFQNRFIMESKNLLIGFAILYVTTGVAIGIKDFLIDHQNHGFTFPPFTVGVGLYYAGYNAEHPKETKLDVFQDLQDEIKANNISHFLQ